MADDVPELNRGAADPAPQRLVPGWVTAGFAVFAVGLIPWVGYLAATLPKSARLYDRVPWVGFDLALMVLLAVTAVLSWLGSPRVALAATATATLLLVDSWFDVTTSVRASDVDAALATSTVEVSLAGLCIWVAHHADSVVSRVVAIPRRMRTPR